jgi:kynurenine formamidase
MPASGPSNWSRWGPDDELGTLNHITEETRRRAATLVRRGASFSLAIPLDDQGPVPPGSHRFNPRHEMVASGSDDPPPLAYGRARATDDTLSMYLQSGTQWDSLAHVYYDEHLYNGFPASSCDANGASRVGIDKSCSQFVSRGVLLDIARLLGKDWLEPDDAVGTEHLDAAARAAGVELGSGDILLLRTGLMASWKQEGSWARFWGPQAGLDPTTIPWFHDHEVAAIAADNAAVEHLHGAPPEIRFHMAALRDLGMCLGELWYLEELATDCAADGIYECMLVAPALPVTGAVGSPVNPIALK